MDWRGFGFVHHARTIFSPAVPNTKISRFATFSSPYRVRVRAAAAQAERGAAQCRVVADLQLYQRGQQVQCRGQRAGQSRGVHAPAPHAVASVRLHRRRREGSRQLMARRTVRRFAARHPHHWTALDERYPGGEGGRSPLPQSFELAHLTGVGAGQRVALYRSAHARAGPRRRQDSRWTGRTNGG